MAHIQAQILMAVAACLCMALLLSLLRPKRGTHNTVSVAVDCNVDEAREGIRQLTADVERLHASVIAARRDMAKLSVERSMIGLPVKQGSEPKGVVVRTLSGREVKIPRPKPQTKKKPTKR